MNIIFRRTRLCHAIALACLAVAGPVLPAYADSDWMSECFPREDRGSPCVQSFSEGLAAVLTGSSRDDSGRWGFIDRNGRMAIAPAFLDARRFSNGLAAVETDKGWGYINSKGDWVISPQFKDAGDFNAQGTALVEYDDRTRLINREGKTVKTFTAGVHTHFAYTFEPNGSYAPMSADQPATLWNIAKGEQLALPPDVTKVGFPQDGLIPAWHRDAVYKGRWGYLDSQGTQWVVAPGVLPEKEMPLHQRGIFAAKRDERWSFFDTAGKPLGNATYGEVAIVRPGVWWVRTDGKSMLLGDKLQPLCELPVDVYLNNERSFGDWVTAATEKAVILIGAEGRIKQFPATKPSIESRDGYLWIMESVSNKSGADEDLEEKQLTQILTLQGEALLDDATRKQLREYSVYPIYRDNDRAEELRLRLPVATLFPKDYNKPQGILTPRGKIVVNAQWKEFATASNTTAPLIVQTSDELYGAIDAEGQWVVTPVYEGMRGFEDGLSWARPRGMEQGRAVLIDAQGKQMSPIPKRVFDDSRREVTNGILIFDQETGSGRSSSLWDIHAGHEIADARFDDIENFKKGYAFARKGDRWGVINTTSRWVIPPVGESTAAIKRLDDTVFVVSHSGKRMRGGYKEELYRLVSAVTGRELCGDLLKEPTRVAPDRYLVHPAAGGVGLIDGTGRNLLSLPQVAQSEEVSEGWITFHTDERSGLINAAGEWRLEPRYASIESLAEPEGLLRVSDGNRYWLVDTQGKEQLGGVDGSPLAGIGLVAVDDEEKRETRLLDLQGREVTRIEGLYAVEGRRASEGLVVFGVSGKYGFIDGQGKRVTGARFDALGPMSNGRAVARQREKSGSAMGFIDRSGRFVIAPQFDWAASFADERALVASKGVTRFIDPKGDTYASFTQRCGYIVVTDGSGKQTWPREALSCAAGKRKKG